MNARLDTLLNHPGLWRGDRLGTAARPGQATGHARLDALLPGGGWPKGALTELLYREEGIGEFSLLLPALAALSREGRWIALIAPPHLPYAPALAAAGLDLAQLLLIRTSNTADTLWAMEEMLRSGACGAVIAWSDTVNERTQRRLQLAAEAGDCTGIWFTPERRAASASFAALRLKLTPSGDGIEVHFIKRRGGGHAPNLVLNTGHALARPPFPRSAAAGLHATA